MLDADDGEPTEVGGRTDCADGRRAGYVFMEPVTDVPEDLELSLRVLMLLALELASIASFDFLTVDATGWEDLDTKSGISGIPSKDGIGSVGERGLGEELLLDSDDAFDGGGSWTDNLCIADPDGDTGIRLGSSAIGLYSAYRSSIASSNRKSRYEKGSVNCIC